MDENGAARKLITRSRYPDSAFSFSSNSVYVYHITETPYVCVYHLLRCSGIVRRCLSVSVQSNTETKTKLQCCVTLQLYRRSKNQQQNPQEPRPRQTNPPAVFSLAPYSACVSLCRCVSAPPGVVSTGVSMTFVHASNCSVCWEAHESLATPPPGKRYTLSNS